MNICKTRSQVFIRALWAIADLCPICHTCLSQLNVLSLRDCRLICMSIISASPTSLRIDGLCLYTERHYVCNGQPEHSHHVASGLVGCIWYCGPQFRLSHDVEVVQAELDWFKAYLCDTVQTVHINCSTSPTCPHTCGVPHGSILNPKLFSIYAAPLSKIIPNNNMMSHFYADDSRWTVCNRSKYMDENKPLEYSKSARIRLTPRGSDYHLILGSNSSTVMHAFITSKLNLGNALRTLTASEANTTASESAELRSPLDRQRSEI